MNRRKTAIFKVGLDALHYTRAHRAMAPFTAGAGIIFTLHNVQPSNPSIFAPNRILTVTPEYLEAVVVRIRAAGLEIVSLDEALSRLRSGCDMERFACLTFDDGYRDNLDHAYPVLKRHDAPFAIYITTCMPDGCAEPWWLYLEHAIAASESITLPGGQGGDRMSCASIEEKYRVYERVYWQLRALDEKSKRAMARSIADSAGVNMDEILPELSLTWEEIEWLAGDRLVTIGAHTVSHPALANLSAAEAEYEIAESRRRIGEKTGTRPRHLAYPYGDPASAGAREFAIAARLGFATAVTTRPGVVYAEHGGHLSALPRVSLNGDYQSLRYLDLFLTGAPFALWNGFRKVNVA